MLSFKTLQKLQQKKFRQQQGLFVVEGKRSVLDALTAASTAAGIEGIFIGKSAQRGLDPTLTQALAPYQRRQLVQIIDDGSFAKLSDTTTPQGIMAVCRVPARQVSDFYQFQRVALLEDIRDPGNLGTMIRTADWFGVDGIVLLKGADPYQPKVVRASMGSLFHVPIVSLSSVEAVKEFQQNGFSVIVTRPESEAGELAPSAKQKLLVAFGSEAHGTSPQLDVLADASFAIPKYGAAESLNVAVSFGIVWSQLRKR